MKELTNLTVSFEGKKILDNVDIFLPEKNEKILIKGQNGSGKTTLSLYLAGLIPDFIKGEVSVNSPIEKPILVRQNPSSQFFGITVRDELDGVNFSGYNIEHLLNKQVFELSEGEKQKVNLIKALNSKGTLLLDEPLELLDPFESKRFSEVLSKTSKGIIWLDKQEVPFFKADKKIELSKKSKTYSKPVKRETGKTVLTANGSAILSKIKINVNINAKRGEKIALIGRNGSGKTTLLKGLGGLIEFKGEKRIDLNSKYSPQNPTHFFFQKKVELEANVEYLEKFSMKEFIGKDPQLLSKGQKKLLSLASTVSNISLWDEPTTWLDEKNKSIVYDYLNESDNTIIMATHDSELIKYCHKILIVEENEVKECSNTKVTQFFQSYQA